MLVALNELRGVVDCFGDGSEDVVLRPVVVTEGLEDGRTVIVD